MTVALIVALFRNADQRWVFAFGGAVLAFVTVIATTALLVRLRRKADLPRVGRRGVLDAQRDVALATKSLPKNLNILTTQMKRVGDLAVKARTRMEEINRSGGDIEKLHREASSISRRIARCAAVMRLHGAAVQVDMDLLIRGYGEWLEWAVKIQQAEHCHVISVSLRTIVAAIDSAIPGIASFRDGTDSLRSVSSDMDLAGSDLREAVDGILNKLHATKAFCDVSLERTNPA